MHPPDKKLNYSLVNVVSSGLLPPLPPKQSWHENEQKFFLDAHGLQSTLFLGEGVAEHLFSPKL